MTLKKIKNFANVKSIYFDEFTADEMMGQKINPTSS